MGAAALVDAGAGAGAGVVRRCTFRNSRSKLGDWSSVPEPFLDITCKNSVHVLGLNT